MATKIDNMAKATTEAAEVSEKPKKKRRSGGFLVRGLGTTRNAPAGYCGSLGDLKACFFMPDQCTRCSCSVFFVRRVKCMFEHV